MKNDPTRPAHCPCGLRVSLPDAAPGLDLEGTVEIACSCGRRLDFEHAPPGWTLIGALVPQGSVPVTGFSRELRLAPDAERFWFEFVDPLGRRIPVHIVFSESRKTAEVKNGDAKPLTVSGISRPTEARRRWLALRPGVSRILPGMRRRGGEDSATPLGLRCDANRPLPVSPR